MTHYDWDPEDAVSIVSEICSMSKADEHASLIEILENYNNIIDVCRECAEINTGYPRTDYVDVPCGVDQGSESGK